jgi:D-alanine transaminase
VTRCAYVNGRYVPHADAAVHIEDRGYQFADGVYEVIALRRGRLLDEEAHMARLDRSLAELEIAPAMSHAALGLVMRELVRRNRLGDGNLYLQMTRGVAPRDHGFPAGVETSLVLTARRAKPQPQALVEQGVAVVTMPDIRWGRCDIKSIALLPNVLGKQAARAAGAYEAWLVDRDGHVTEGTSSNAWIVTAAGRLVTRKTGNDILAGVTRRSLIALLGEQGLALEERPFTVAEAKAAREALLTSTTSAVLAVTRIDGAKVGGGRPGKLFGALRRIYLDYADGAGASG